jgi:4-amino-4-deoxy-L-arabinose transferase-like glycosyltransferase
VGKQQKGVLLAMSILALLYFILFIPPNLTGAKDVNMISVFEHDEFAQYPHLINMLTRGDTFYQSLRNFLIYEHYYFGYPFYFLSAVVLLPYKVIAGSDWVSRSDIIMLLLRQLINVLPQILGAFFLVWMIDRFRTWWKALLAMALILFMPAVVGNNLWWHPDGLLFLFCVLTLFFLLRDDFRFGWNFRIAGVMTGLAIGAKLLGILFVLTYVVYLLYGLLTKRVKLKKLILTALLELLIIAGTVVVTNPLLLLPQERAEIISTFKANLGQSTEGFWIVTQNKGGNWSEFFSTLSSNYVSLIFSTLAILLAIYGCFSKETRFRNILILSWVIGFCAYFLIFAATIRTHYFIPVVPALVIPMFPVKQEIFKPRKINFHTVILWVFVLAAILQIGMNIPKDYLIYKKTLTREQTSTSLQLFNEAEQLYLDRIPDDVRVKIYRDWRAYVHPRSNFRIVYNWELATYSYLQDTNPDILFIESENAQYFSDTSKLDQAIKPVRMEQMYTFYSDVLHEQVEGYRLLLKTEFGYVFAREDFAAMYFGDTP